MNRRNITWFIISCVIAIALIAAGFAFKYYSAFKKVTIVVSQQDLTGEIYERDPNTDQSNNDTKMGSVRKGSQTFSLQPGKYYVIPDGNKYDQSPIYFTVDTKDISVTVNPGLSSSYLATILNQNIAAIRTVITSKYASIIGNFTLNQGKLYLDGSWYGTTLVQASPGPGQLGDVYRTVLQKVNGTWQFAAPPALVLTTPDYSTIPASILTDLNSQSGYY